MVALTFPDGARRDYPQRHNRPRHRQGHFAFARQAHGGDGARRQARRSCRSDRARRQDRISDPRRSARAGTHPPRRRACARRSGADAVARHAGHHRPGDRERLLLRFLPQRSRSRRKISPPSRRRCARSSRATNRSPRKSGRATEAKTRLRRHGRELQGRAGRRHSGRPADQNLQARRLVRSVPRSAHDLDRQDRQCVQADESRRRLLARQFKPRNAVPHLRHRVRQAGRARRLSQADRGSGKARPPQTRPRNGSVPFPGRSARLGVLASQRLDAVPDAGKLHPPPPGRRRLCRGQRAAAHRFLAVGRVRPHGDVPRGDVSHRAARGGRAHLRGQADELPRPHPDFQERAEILPRPAVQDRRVRQGAPLRAVGRAARADAGARFHPGRRAYLHHRGADRRAKCSRSTI